MSLEFISGKPSARGARGMVVCPHRLASAAGADMLRAGGSAVDAAVAAAAALAGHAHGITVDGKGGYLGGADPRSDGEAIGVQVADVP